MNLEIQTLIDTRKRTVIKLVGTGSGDDTGNLVVNVANLAGYSPQSVTNIGNVALVEIKYAHGCVSNDGHVRLYWYGKNANANIATFSAGEFALLGETDPVVITNNATGPTGDIYVATRGFSSVNSAYTLILDIRKDSRYFNPGYDVYAQDFNQ